MYDISELEITGKDIAIAVLICVVLMVAIFCAGYLCGWERAEDVYCNGSGTESVGQQLNEVGTAISNAGEGIQAAQGTANAISGTIADAQVTVDYISGTAKDSTELIRQSQSIIAGIRQRGEAHTIKN